MKSAYAARRSPDNCIQVCSAGDQISNLFAQKQEGIGRPLFRSVMSTAGGAGCAMMDRNNDAVPLSIKATQERGVPKMVVPNNHGFAF